MATRGSEPPNGLPPGRDAPALSGRNEWDESRNVGPSILSLNTPFVDGTEQRACPYLFKNSVKGVLPKWRSAGLRPAAT